MRALTTEMAGEHEAEPIRGLPGPLPDGERLLWQGAPDAKRLAFSAFHVRAIAVYFALMLAWRGVSALYDGQTPAEAAVAVLWLVPLAGAGLAVLALLAWVMARSTVYTITSRRVVLRYGIALPMVVNVPYTIVAGAALKTFRDGCGDIPIALTGKDRLAFLHLWPHVRPWRLRDPEPMLRSVPDAVRVARILGAALKDAAGESAAVTATAPSPANVEAKRPAGETENASLGAATLAA